MPKPSHSAKKAKAEFDRLLWGEARTEQRPVVIDHRVAAWLNDGRVARYHLWPVFVNHAVGFCALQEISRGHGLQMHLKARESGDVTELPVVTGRPVGAIHDVPFVSSRVVMLEWLKQNRGIDTDMAVHHGMHILAAVAVASANEDLVLEGSRDTVTIDDRLITPGVPSLYLP